MRERDEEERLREVEKRRAETLLADENAKEAQRRQVQRNQMTAAEMKTQAAENETRRQLEAGHRIAVQKELVKEVQSQREKPALAMEEVAVKNRMKAATLRADSERLEAERRVEWEKEEARRADIIKQIRAIELVPKVRQKALDPTYTPQLGLLEEMSLAELRERLRLVEEERKEEEEERRAKIITAKQEHAADLQSRVTRLTQMRDLSQKQARHAPAHTPRTCPRVAGCVMTSTKRPRGSRGGDHRRGAADTHLREKNPGRRSRRPATL